MPFYKRLNKRLGYLEPNKRELVHQAYLMALQYHSGQQRASGEKYIAHPVAVANILINMHLDYQSIIAALLHDVVEDTPATKEDIAAKFGDVVADLVDGVTKLTQIESSNKTEVQAQNFRKMMLAMSRDIRVILIKLADRLHNMQTITSIAATRRFRIARETLDLYAPIANRLGMYSICIQLEDLAFATLYPRRYATLAKTVEQIYGKNQEVVKLLTKELHAAFAKSPLKKVVILGRMKHLYGIYKKMLSHRASFANIMDVYAFRIIVQNVTDCYRALGVVHTLYKPIPGKFKDHIALPKFNGYQSLHTVLFGPYGAPVEIQIRTQSMDQTANDGIAAHWLYKNTDETVSATHMRAQQWVNKLLEMQQHVSSSAEFFENIKVDLFPDKVYVFTPKGDIVELMRGATVIDFAYALHSKIGNTCVAARVNRKFSPLSTILHNGQTVSIITSEKEEPNPAWLNFVVTSRARNSIRQYLKYKKRAELIVLGKRLLDKACADLAVAFFSIRPAVLDALTKELGFKKVDDLYEDIGLGNHLATLIAYRLIHSDQHQRKASAKTETKPLIIYGAEGVAISFATCCYPIPGDAIVGYLNVGCGLEIHTKNCSNLTKLRQHPEKCLPVSWANNVQGDFCVALSIEVTNELGALAELTQAIFKAHANVYDISINERNDDYALLTLHILVKNTVHLERVKRHINSVAAVIGVIRNKG